MSTLLICGCGQVYARCTGRDVLVLMFGISSDDVLSKPIENEAC